MARVRRRKRATEAADTAAKTESAAKAGKKPRWRGWVLRRLPIVVIAALIAAVPGGGAVAVSRINERAVPDDQARASSSWSDDDSDYDDSFDGAGDVEDAWTPSTRGRSTSLGTAQLVSDLGGTGIPTVAMQAYVKAARTMTVVDPSCGIEWSLLAAIGRVESNHGRYGGAALLEDGAGTRPIRGVALDGGGEVARILDTDNGRLDGDDVYDRAVGPMQFIPSSWQRVAADGNDDGESDPNNIYDAALGAAVYLCAGDIDLRDLSQRRQAVLRYNHSDEYAATVLALASAYERGQRGPLPTVTPTRSRPATVGTPTLPPANPGPTPSLRGSRGRDSAVGGRPPATGTSTTRPRSTTSRPSTTRPPTSSTSRPPSTSTSTTSTSTTTSTTSTTRPGPVLHQVATDQLPSGPWSLWAGGGAQGVVLELRLPGRTWREEDTTAALSGRWTVASTDRRHVAWGLTGTDVATIAITMSDGRVVSVPTVELAVAGVDRRVFAAQLPEGVTITAAEGRRADGSVAARANDVAASLGPVTGFDPAVRATVPVAAVAPPPPPSSTTSSSSTSSSSSSSTSSSSSSSSSTSSSSSSSSTPAG
jgi:hypothetical protein